MCDTGTKYYGELTEQMLKNKERRAPHLALALPVARGTPFQRHRPCTLISFSHSDLLLVGAFLQASPGSENGSGLFQTLASFKIREAFESLTA